MIDLNLLLFGGNGSGSGGGKKGTGATDATSYSTPSRHGSAGGTSMSSGGNVSKDRKESSESREETTRKSTAVSEPVSRITDPNATYVLYDTRGKEVKDISGSSLLRDMKSAEIHYNPRTEKWETSKGTRYIIRRRR